MPRLVRDRPAALVALGVDDRHRDDVLEPLEEAVDDRAVRPRARGGDIQVVAAGLGRVVRAPVRPDPVAEERVLALERAVVRLLVREIGSRRVDGSHRWDNVAEPGAFRCAAGATRGRARVTSAGRWRLGTVHTRVSRRPQTAARKPPCSQPCAPATSGPSSASSSRYHAALVRVARQYVPTQEIAEDVAQEAWLGLLRGLDAFEGRSSLRTYLFRIVMNLARTRGVREARSAPFSSLGSDDEGGPVVDPERFLPRPSRCRPLGLADPPVEPERRADRALGRGGGAGAGRRSRAARDAAPGGHAARRRGLRCRRGMRAAGALRGQPARPAAPRAHEAARRRSRSTTHEPDRTDLPGARGARQRLHRGHAAAPAAPAIRRISPGAATARATSSRCARRSPSPVGSARRTSPPEVRDELLGRSAAGRRGSR